MLTKLKKRVQGWLATEAAVLYGLGFTPNRISASGLLFAVLSALAYACWTSNQPLTLVTAAVLLLLSGFCDAMDGVIARIYGEATAFGGFLDSVLDRYADALVLTGVILGGLCDIFWGFLAILGSLLTSYARARAEAAGVPMESIGLVERAERIIILAIATFLSVVWPVFLWWAVVLLALLTNLTVLQRMAYFYEKTRQK